MESRSGETYSPHHSWSSPVLTMIVSSSGGTIRLSPSTNFAPPVPPVSTVIMLRSAHSHEHQLPRSILISAAQSLGTPWRGLPAGQARRPSSHNLVLHDLVGVARIPD